MERLFKQILPTLIAIGAGLLMLVGYLVPVPDLTALLVHWAVVVAAFALILGFFNVLRVHLTRFFRGKKGWPYSIALLITALVSFGATTIRLLPGLLDDPTLLPSSIMNITRQISDGVFNHVILPLEAGAAGLIAFALVLAAFRLMRSKRRNTVEAIIFLIAALIVLLAATPLPNSGWIATFRDGVGFLALAGMRGLLIGVGLGTLVVGVRIITGLDRPHSDI
ncbi:MAG: hypothetical protein JXD18_05165 [Anaerolineae bacterium]|nr:hypothetical protein [Anaerolineae bacterium]